MTNLRLPGQYDERLFAAAGISGMQGPYYNWNRWYLPSLGRYLELDPIALQGGLNGRGAPDWYNYALGNPNRYIDPEGDVAVAIPPIIWGIGWTVAAWEAYVAMCTANHTCPWNQQRCDPAPPPPPPPDDPCGQQYDIDMDTCRGVSRFRGKRAAARCYSSAMDRLVACRSGQPLPPLDVWNN